MTNSRRQQIEAMLADEPDDVFLRYSLAMELDNEEDHERSLQILRELTHESPPYVPAYFMAGKQLARIAQIEQAREILREGIEQAREQGNAHAASEMSEFLTALGHAG